MPNEKKYTIVQILLLGIVALFLQIFFIPIIKIGVCQPDLILLVVIFLGYRFGVIEGIIGGFILGLLQDSISASTLGVSSLANCIIGFIAGQTKQFKMTINAKVLIFIILILVHGGIFYIFYQIKTETTYVYLIMTRVFPNTVYTFVIGLLTSFFMRSKFNNI